MTTPSLLSNETKLLNDAGDQMKIGRFRDALKTLKHDKLFNEQ